ncbi:hypothetical protein [Robertkochia marina]|uniref:hypothetical protein n=1 Tax=Robertkochia marina TaxID=1227945 RepID=UPI001454BCD8|nr:hypothetical protein [Robertkochia marina]
MNSKTSENKRHLLTGFVMISLGLIIAGVLQDQYATVGILLMALGGLFMIPKMH